MRALLPAILGLIFAVSAPAQEPSVEALNHLQSARRWLEAKQPTRAETELVRALLLHPRWGEAWLELARARALRDDADGVLLAAQAAIDVDPGCAEAHALLGALHARAGHATVALVHYDEAERLAAAGKALAPDARARGAALLAAATHADADAIKTARDTLASPGAPQRIVAQYFGRARHDAGRGHEGSVEAGGTLTPELLRVVVLDAAGRRTRVPFVVRGGGGFAVDPAAVPVTLRAPTTPGDGHLRIGLEATAGDPPVATVELPLAAVGPLVKLEIQPAEGAVRAGQRLHLRLTATDTAGRRLWFPEFAWEAKHEAIAPGALVRSTSIVTSENCSESHRNIYEVRREDPAPPGTTIRIVARSLDGAQTAEAVFRVEAGEADGRSAAGGIAWSFDYEAALAQAQTEQKPLFVEVMADW